jgi:xanthine dehydrogenase small subunit
VSLRFLVNDSVVETSSWAMTPALDFIRRNLGLTGTKGGCREGDCGACAVLVGERTEGSYSYKAMPSCLLALGELDGRHLVTIEGLAAGGPTAVTRAIAEANGSQCGFCSPGLVVSLTAYLMSGSTRGEEGLSVEGAYSAIEGNLCRCTGYGSIKRAAARLVEEFSRLPADPRQRLAALVSADVVPPSLLRFVEGRSLPAENGPNGRRANDMVLGGFPLGGGTDFFVRNPEPDPAAYPEFEFLDRRPELRRVELRSSGVAHGTCLELGAALTWREFFSEPKVLKLVPGIEHFEKALASPLVRERATIGGNIANASPVGDLTAMLLALGACVRIEGSGRGARELPLERLFLGYKKLDLSPSEGGAPGEFISAVLLPASRPFAFFNFEKVSKRERLDIAAVNTAASFALGEDSEKAGPRIARARLSAGGVAPVPLVLEKTGAFLEGRTPDAETAVEAARIAVSEASPIGDVRGSADYRRRLLGRLVLGHFLRLFPGIGLEKAGLEGAMT